MCGIYACLGDYAASKKVLEGLKRIEYRGYDSWGIAVCQNNSGLKIEKHKGKISLVKNLKLQTSNYAIGHTRWATHGGVSDENAHPHLSQNKKFALVQNGILENFSELKKELQKTGYKFKTETDTEVIVALIEKECKEKINTRCFTKVIKRMKGRNTILLLTKNGEAWAYRQGSPLILGKNKKSYFFSSDLASISSDANEYYPVKDREIVHFDGQKIESHNCNEKIEFKKIDQKALEIDKGEYPHFMLKEICEQETLMLSVLSKSKELFPQIAEKISKSKNVYVVGAGSASYAAMSIVFELRKVLQNNIYHLPSYDYKNFENLFSDQDLAIILSQSGETADTIEAVEKMKKQQIFIVSVVNAPSSTLSNMADIAYPLNVGAEVGVASTKALTGHMLFGMALADYLKTSSFSFNKRLENYLKDLKTFLHDQKSLEKIKLLAKYLSKKSDLYILGRGQLLASALEFALKIKEVSYLHAEGFSSGELKHGVIALIEKNTPVICLVDRGNKENMISSAYEVKARGAKVIGIAQENESVFDFFLNLPFGEEFAKLSTVITAQLIAYNLALLKKLNPDKPRNLAKSVTVK